MVTNGKGPKFNVGDRVRIRYSTYARARIIEFRGPLAPGGAFVYRVRVPNKPRPIDIEVREDQLTRLPTPPKLAPSPLAASVPTPPQPPIARPRGPKLRPPRLPPAKKTASGK